MKRAIYLDNWERDLTHRVLTAVVCRLDARIGTPMKERFDKMAIRWTKDEVNTLAAKFEEPTPKKGKTAEKAHA